MEQFKKLSEKDIGDIIEREDSITKHLTDKVKWEYIGAVSDLSAEFEWCLSDCESPIEQSLSIELERLMRNGGFDIPILVDVLGIDRQYEVRCGDKIYRADFALHVNYWNGLKIFLVECDGHEFHQKTKEQVEKDNERTRDLQNYGYTVIRFSGTEIYHKPRKCALEITKIIKSPALRFMQRMIDNEQSK